ncbi:MAG: prepilin peptidase [Verrucomicrobia bacterium]|nr:prepilin peptidase [Verrucomicrobiota bacterium]
MAADTNPFTALPMAFWAAVFFVFGAIVGSFLNVCIHRMPRGESIVSPPSHCPHCQYSIPWFLNLPLVTWLYLRGRCANCGATIASRYFLVELLTALLFTLSWLGFGPQAPWIAVVCCVFLAGLVVATFIDFEHYIIPDEITFGGMAVGFFLSGLVPGLHGVERATDAMKNSVMGIAAGAGVIYAVLRVGKVFFGRQQVELEGGGKIVFSETALHLPDQTVPYDEFLYRKTDTVRFHARTLELVDRCYWNVDVALRQDRLIIGNDELDPETVPHLEAMTDSVELPREAMGFGDVKFMAAIGAFLGAKAVLFCLMLSSILGSAVGVTLIALRRQEWSSKLPYGPYIAFAAFVWVFAGGHILNWLFGR